MVKVASCYLNQSGPASPGRSQQESVSLIVRMLLVYTLCYVRSDALAPSSFLLLLVVRPVASCS